MKLPTHIRYADELLAEAMQMLESLRGKLAMFDKSHYCDLKKRVDQHRALGENLQNSLNDIETEG